MIFLLLHCFHTLTSKCQKGRFVALRIKILVRLGVNCSFGLPYVLYVFLLIVILVISHFGFDGGTLVLIASVTGLAYLLLSIYKILEIKAPRDIKFTPLPKLFITNRSKAVVLLWFSVHLFKKF